jgi:predicted  nucleic acid-binding Zn-ribbon protein
MSEQRFGFTQSEVQRLAVENENLQGQLRSAEGARADVERRLADATAEIGRLRQAMRNTIGSMRLEADQLERDLDDSRPT